MSDEALNLLEQLHAVLPTDVGQLDFIVEEMAARLDQRRLAGVLFISAVLSTVAQRHVERSLRP